MQTGIVFKREELEAMVIAKAANLTGADAQQLRVTWTVGGSDVNAFVSHIEHGVPLSLPRGQER